MKAKKPSSDSSLKSSVQKLISKKRNKTKHFDASVKKKLAERQNTLNVGPVAKNVKNSFGSEKIVTSGNEVSKRKRKRAKKAGSRLVLKSGEQSFVNLLSSSQISQTDGESYGKSEAKIKKLREDSAVSLDSSVNPGLVDTKDSLDGKRKREKYQNSKRSSLREKMMARLSAARFRFINEELYTWDGQESPAVFSTDSQSFKAYHDGFKQQTKLWPINPLDVVIRSIKKMPNSENKVIADFGCGEAKLALELSSNKVFSFDLVALNDRVTVADNAKTKLYSASVDVAVHCLSLMSSNISGYVKEANRVLKAGGLLKIAEVESRFDNVDKFVENVCKFNFKLVKKDLSHNLFYFMDFEKVGNIGVARKRKLPTLSLNPCLYKKR